MRNLPSKRDAPRTRPRSTPELLAEPTCESAWNLFHADSQLNDATVNGVPFSGLVGLGGDANFAKETPVMRSFLGDLLKKI